jgi:uncharacterized membrane protein required for colicin V production
VLVFLIFYILLRIIFSVAAKLVKKVPGITAVDRIIGAIFGLIVAFGLVFIFAELVRLSATVITYFAPDSTMFAAVEDTLIFKYFF